MIPTHKKKTDENRALDRHLAAGGDAASVSRHSRTEVRLNVGVINLICP